MNCFIQLNLDYLRDHPDTPRVEQSGVRYGRTVEWDTIPALYARRFGDCKSLTAAYIAEEVMAGRDAVPAFRFAPPPHEFRYHILVQKPDGYYDPSKTLGMGQNENEQTYWTR